MSVNLAVVLDDLVSYASIFRQGPRSEGEGWCAYEVQLGQSQWVATLQVSRVAKHLNTLVDSDAADGFALDASQGDYFAIDLTLSGDVDWPSILTFLRGVSNSMMASSTTR